MGWVLAGAFFEQLDLSQTAPKLEETSVSLNLFDICVSLISYSGHNEHGERVQGRRLIRAQHRSSKEERTLPHSTRLDSDRSAADLSSTAYYAYEA